MNLKRQEVDSNDKYIVRRDSILFKEVEVMTMKVEAEQRLL